VDWVVERVPAEGTGFLHTAAAGHGSVWAFGISVDGGRPFGTLVFRRDERGWRRVEVPGIGRVNRAVVVSETEVWVVGDGTSLHWSGGAWRVVPIEVLPDREAQLFGLVAFGGSDVWTAGFAAGPDDARGVVQRWDGTRWSDLPLPDVAEHWGLAGVHGVAPDDLWVVGGVHDPVGPAVALHWDGSVWRFVQVPMPGDGTATLSDVVALAGDDVWAAGHWRPEAGPGRLPFAVHWDGSTWSLGVLPGGRGQIGELVATAGGVVGVGQAGAGGCVVEFDGTGWRAVPGPPVPEGAERCSLHGGTLLPDGRLLVVGAGAAGSNSARPYAAVLGTSA
jgi:hypothetical protein